MLWTLRILFLLILASMLAVTSWAGLQGSLWEIPREVRTHPWFVATLVDAYWGFITFYVWVAWKENSPGGRLLWFFAIILLGNIAMASYVLVELFRRPPTALLRDILVRRNPGHLTLPAFFTVAGIMVYWLA